MKNWFIDENSFKSKKQKEVWELIHKINYGLNNQKISKSKVLEHWELLKEDINPYSKRVLEFLIWGRVYSLPTNLKFWSWSPKTKI